MLAKTDVLSNPSEVCYSTHHFSEGIYNREIFMPAGLLIIGKAHKTQHLNIVLTGSCDVMIDGVIKHIQAPHTFESLPGSQKTLYIYEDCRWMTVHVNVDNEHNLDVLEDRYIDSDDKQPALMLEAVKSINERNTNVLDNDSSSSLNGYNSDADKRTKQSSSSGS